MYVVFVAVKRAFGWLWLPALLLLAACGGLAGEPQIIATLPQPTPAPTSFPASAPDLALGAQIYAANCTRCHGIAGRGDGPLVGTGEGQVPPPPDFTDPVTTSNQTPLIWFNTITNGRIQNLMPPWRDALSEEERWAVAMYTWAMHYQPDLIVSGQAQWSAQANATPNLPPQPELVNLSDDALLSSVSASAGITDFVSSLNTADRQALAAYLRTTSVTNVDVIGKPLAEIAQVVTPQPASPTSPPNNQPITTPETTAEATALASAAGTISGQVTNGTAGGSVPSGLKMTLRTFDLTTGGEDIVETRETTLNTDGTYTFGDVPLQIGRAYDVFTFYQGRSFGNSVIPQDLSTATFNLPIILYELTNDPAVVQISGMVSQIVASNGTLQVAQVYSFTNTSDRVFTTDDNLGQNSVGETRFGSVSVSVPPGAQLLGFADTQTRYVVSDDGRTVTDTSLVLPGEGHILHLLYTLPYTGDLQVEQPVNYAVNGPVRLLVTPGNVAVSSSLLPSIGPQTLRNVTYQGYGGNLTLAPNDVIRYQLRGLPTSTGEAGTPNVVSGGTLVAVILVGIGAVIIAVGLYIYLRGRSGVPASANGPAIHSERSLIDGLVQQIAELDETKASGQLDEATYQKRRRRLKARLAELMDQE